MGFFISASPDPATPGSWILVCYDFTHGASSPVTILIYKRPDPNPIEEQLDAENHCVQVYVPPGCTGLRIVDQSGQSGDCSVAVTP